MLLDFYIAFDNIRVYLIKAFHKKKILWEILISATTNINLYEIKQCLTAFFFPFLDDICGGLWAKNAFMFSQSLEESAHLIFCKAVTTGIRAKCLPPCRDEALSCSVGIGASQVKLFRSLWFVMTFIMLWP